MRAKELDIGRLPAVPVIVGLSLALCCAVTLTAIGDEKHSRSSTPSAEAPWIASLEREGLETDSASLEEIAVSNSSLPIRMTSLQLLSLRGDDVGLQPLLTRLLEDDTVFDSVLSYISNWDPSQAEKWREQGIVPPLIVRFRQDVAILMTASSEKDRGLEALDRLQEQEKDADRLRIMAMARVRLGDFSTYPLIVAAARSEDTSARSGAVVDLLDIMRMDSGPAEVEPGERPSELLKILARDKKARIRKHVAFRIGSLRPTGSEGDSWKVILKELAEKDPDEAVRQSARQALEDIQ